MTQPSAPEHVRQYQNRPTCPFCGVPWTDQMMDELDAMTGTSSCSCCADPRWPIPVAKPIPLPTSDLCCAACGKAIYRAVRPGVS